MGPTGADGNIAALLGTASFGGSAWDAAECTMGEVGLSAASFGYGLGADGSLLPIASNQALYSLFGTRFGGNGVSTFALPDLHDVAPKESNGAALNYFICSASGCLHLFGVGVSQATSIRPSATSASRGRSGLAGAESWRMRIAGSRYRQGDVRAPSRTHARGPSCWYTWSIERREEAPS